MTTTSASHHARRATRDSQQPILGGVAGGLARHLGAPVLWVRAGFLVAATLGGMGVFLYAGLWLVLPASDAFENAPPGLEGASRDGRRPGRLRRLTDVGPAVVLAALGVGALLVVNAVVGGQGVALWAALLGIGGVALLWRQADEAQRERWLDSTGRVDPVRVVLGNGGWASYTRLGAGLLLLVGALVLVGLREGSVSLARDVTVISLLAIVGIGIVVGPWIYRLAADLTAERAERVRTQDRADVAAHLHDSVLQTLALIQKNADDGPTVARLARAQERDLRGWLYVGDSTDESTVAGALRQAAASIEDTHGVSVELVVVGDGPYGDALVPVVRATGEAITNAAKHAGVDRVDVYAEVSEAAVDVFVRDRGTGFDPGSVPEDRYGLRHSVRDRMARHGGTSDIRSSPGEGTEVRLHLPITGATRDDQ